ncbi:hypothetical protein HYDPIDRAFT_36476 [Hydnomerulius pinastri MD-312]|nr:hypothetical protein HYDPIDRAFT_36476 [Hydnomerulius pinastri MD-312]
MTISQKPIVLWNQRKHTSQDTDEGGVAITKSVLAPPVRATQYDAYEPTFTGTVPPLAYFCIRTLSAFPEQLHTLGHLRFTYRDDVARALLPSRSQCESTPQGTENADFDITALDPRLWSTLAQVMHPLPEQLHDLDLPLADIHLPLLQQIPSTPDFSLVTLLSLPNCREICDDTIVELRRLNGLVALDLRGTSVSPYGLTVLARGLSWTQDEDSGFKRRTGIWGLRILRLHSCTSIDNKVLPILHKFPLLSAIDLRFTRCTRAAVRKQLGDLGFNSLSKKSLFHPAPLSLALCTLDKIASSFQTPISLYSCPPESVFRIHVDELFHSSSHQQATAPRPTSSWHPNMSNPPAMHTFSSATEDTVVFIPPAPKSSATQDTKAPLPQSSRSVIGMRRLCSPSRVSPEPRGLAHHPSRSKNITSAPPAQGSEPQARIISSMQTRRLLPSLRDPPEYRSFDDLTRPMPWTELGNTGLRWRPTSDSSLPASRTGRQSRMIGGELVDVGDIEWDEEEWFSVEDPWGEAGMGSQYGESESDEDEDEDEDEEHFESDEEYDSETYYSDGHSPSSPQWDSSLTLPYAGPSYTHPIFTSLPSVDVSFPSSSFYQNSLEKTRYSTRSTLPMSAQNIHQSIDEDGQHESDPLAIARQPPPWSMLDASSSSSGTVTSPPSPRVINHPASFAENRLRRLSRRSQKPAFGTIGGLARTETLTKLDDPAKLDRARLNKRGSGGVTDMVNKLASKRVVAKVESEFVLARRAAKGLARVKSRNPFAKSAKSVFAENKTVDSKLEGTSKSSLPSTKPESRTLAKPNAQTQPESSSSRKKPRLEESAPETSRSSKPLKPITTLKPPMLPKEFLPPPPLKPKPAPKSKVAMKQARLSLQRAPEVEAPIRVSREPKYGKGVERSRGNAQRAKGDERTFDWDNWGGKRRTSI